MYVHVFYILKGMMREGRLEEKRKKETEKEIQVSEVTDMIQGSQVLPSADCICKLETQELIIKHLSEFEVLKSMKIKRTFSIEMMVGPESKKIQSFFKSKDREK